MYMLLIIGTYVHMLDIKEKKWINMIKLFLVPCLVKSLHNNCIFFLILNITWSVHIQVIGNRTTYLCNSVHDQNLYEGT